MFIPTMSCKVDGLLFLTNIRTDVVCHDGIQIYDESLPHIAGNDPDVLTDQSGYTVIVGERVTYF